MPSPSPMSRLPRPTILLVASLMAAAIGTGCGSSKSTYLYSAPDEYDIRSEVVVEAGFDEVWDRLTEGIRDSGWKLGAEDRDRGKLQFTVPGADPGQCVDCGRLKRGTEEFAVARSHQEGYRDSNSRRTTRLEARVGVDLERRSNKTRVKVDIWYVLDVDDQFLERVQVTNEQVITTSTYDSELDEITGPSRTVIPGKTRSFGQRRRNTIHFTTSGGDSANWGTPEEPLTILCRSTGGLEQSILDLASGKE